MTRRKSRRGAAAPPPDRRPRKVVQVGLDAGGFVSRSGRVVSRDGRATPATSEDSALERFAGVGGGW